MRPVLPLACLTLALVTAAAGLSDPQPERKSGPKPDLKVEADGFPAGSATPEGAACDLARAFIKRDARLFRTCCVRLYAGGTGPKAYASFLNSTTQSIKNAAKIGDAAGGPVSIAKVFAARSLSKNGPASYGEAAFGFQALRFVDVSVVMPRGGQSLNRTLVIQDRDGKWYVHPCPSASPLLSEGLNREPASKQDFSEAYTVLK